VLALQGEDGQWEGGALTRWSDRGQFDDDVTFVVAAMTA
jgi:hypothetical protein